MLGELSGSLAHELNQPLAAILSNAQAALRLLAEEPIDLGEVREIVRDIIADDKRASEIIRRLRLLLTKGEINQQPLDMNQVVLDVLKLVRADLQSHGVVVETDLQPDLPRVSGDNVQLQQVLLNLVMNASEAVLTPTSVERRITIRTRRTDDAMVRTSVIDRGCGILPDRIDAVFEPFFTTKPEGLGLGLAVCRTIIQAHEGSLSASNNADHGATFDLSLHPLGGSR